MAIVAIGAVVSLLRVPLSHVDTVWAEDGNLFLAEAIMSGPWSVLVTGYAGYQHLVPRIATALILSVVPIDGFGIAVFVVCSLLVGLVAAAIFWLSRDLVPWMPARLVLAAITIALPLSAQEVLGNLADIHSYALWLMPWLLLYRPRTLSGGIGWGVVALLCAMTEIQAIVFLPLLLLMVRPAHRTAWPIGVGFLLGMLGQLLTTLLTPRDSAASWLGLRSIVLGYLYNTVLPLLNPDPVWQNGVLAASGPLVPALVALPFAVAIVVAVLWGTTRQRILIAALVVASFALYAAAVTIDGGLYFAYAAHNPVDGFWGIQNSRYGVASGMLLAATVPVAASALVVRFAGATRATVISTIAVCALVGWFAFASTLSFSARESGVTWSGSVREAREQCESDDIDGGRVLVAPERMVTLPCDLLLR